MPYKDPEKQKLYKKEYYQLNKEKNKERDKEYREANKDKIKAYKELNREKIKEQKKEYNQTEAGKKSLRISQWKHMGVKYEDFNALYEHYLNCKNCQECNVEFYGNGANKRCLDHDHETGKFRNVLCHICNVRRG